MHRRLAVIAVCLGAMGSAGAAFGADSYRFEDFRADGFSAAPAPGALDSNRFRVMGASAGPMNFGDSRLTGDFARGAAVGPVSTGGVYAFDVSRGGADPNFAFGFQPTGSDFSPGGIEFRWTNRGPAMVDAIQIDYELLQRNNGGRSSAIDFYLVDQAADAGAATGTPGGPVVGASKTFGSARVVSPGPADPVGTWAAVSRSLVIDNLALAPQQSVVVGWRHTDLGGSGARDEFALDDLSVAMLRFIPEPATGLLTLVCGSIVPWAARTRRRRGLRHEDGAADPDGTAGC